MAGVIPWTGILKALPTIIDGADRLWKHWASRNERPVDPDADIKVQLAAVDERLSALGALCLSLAALLTAVLK